MTDEEIVELFWARSEEAVKETQNKYEAYLMKISYNILSNLEDSRECVNDTYLAAWNSMPEQRPSVLSTYLGKIIRQCSIDVYRKKHSVKRYASEYAISLSELEDCCSDSGSVEKTYNERLLRETINQFLRTLSEEERGTFIGRYYYFDSLKEVAGYYNMSEAKAKSMLFRTRRKLEQYLRKEGF